ncbi:MAG: DUF3127 domain-containing protein [Bacteroidales bacterium]|nr:DUF3127 domain-containing protein [Bacteroidales bacterium]
MEIKGTISAILPLQEGEGRNGKWKKQNFILDTGGQFPKKVCITIWGDKIDEFNLQQGEMITAHIDIESREFKERWYTDVKAWRIDRNTSQDAPPPPTPPGDFFFDDPGTPHDQSKDLPSERDVDNSNDDLPF